MADKEFKTLDEQIAILQSRGLMVPDVDTARSFLLCNNYYRISGYSLTLRSHDQFHEGTTFQNIMDIYNFDQEIRHILLRYIEIIEVTIKSIFAYEFTKQYGPTGYLDASHFVDEAKHQEIIEKAEKQKNSRLPHEAYLKHYVEELKQDIPLWAYVDLFTISDISFLYKISEEDIKNAVATAWGFKTRGADILTSFMHSMTIVRNLCAHGSRLYNRIFEQKPWLNKEEQNLLFRDKENNTDNAHLFGFILVMRRLLKKEDFFAMMSEITTLEKKYPFVCMRYYGFPDNWKTVL